MYNYMYSFDLCILLDIMCIKKYTLLIIEGARGNTVEAPRYKSEGRGFDLLWCH